MKKEGHPKIDAIFKKLNQEDKDHALRISDYLARHGMTAPPAH